MAGLQCHQCEYRAMNKFDLQSHIDFGHGNFDCSEHNVHGMSKRVYVHHWDDFHNDPLPKSLIDGPRQPVCNEIFGEAAKQVQMINRIAHCPICKHPVKEHKNA